MAKRQHRLLHRLYYDEKYPDRYVTLKCSPATKTVTLARNMVDTLNGKAGSTIACMNANCAMRVSAEGAFPHPVYLVEFTATSVYVVDKLDRSGQPVHCVWYKHNDRETVDIHDRLGPKAVVKAGLANRTITLRPPKIRLGQKNPPNVTGTSGKSRPREDRGRARPIPYGARRRAQKAGLLVLP